MGHRGYGIFGLLVAIISFAIAVVGLHGDDTSDKGRNTHRALGYAVMAVGVFQPIKRNFPRSGTQNSRGDQNDPPDDLGTIPQVTGIRCCCGRFCGHVERH